MSELQDLVSIMNVTIKGLEELGSLSITVAKGSAFVASRAVQVAQWVGKTMNGEAKTGGKLKINGISRKFTDLRYSELPLLSPEIIHKQLCEMYPGQYNLTKIKTLLNPVVLQAEFEHLAKKHGLLYARVPNFIPDKATGVVELRFAYSKSQTDAKEAVLAQMQAYIAKQLKKCGVKQQAAQEYAEQQIPTKDTTFTESLAQIDVEKVSEEDFNKAMLITYPDYKPATIETKQPPAELQAEYQHLLETTKPEKTAAVSGRTFPQIEQKQHEMPAIAKKQPLKQNNSRQAHN